MIISIRNLKKELKKKLKIGTYISAEVYPIMDTYVRFSLAELNIEIANTFTDSNDRKVTSVHVEKAMLNLILSRSAEESLDKERINKIWRQTSGTGRTDPSLDIDLGGE